MRTLAIGDIHGNYKGLLQCLERSGFDKSKDRLITLGDIVDGLPDVKDCVEELLTVLNRVDVVGNHDQWFLEWLAGKPHPDNWSQGGRATRNSYSRDPYSEPSRLSIPDSHTRFFQNQKLYHEENKRLFVHAGLPKGYSTAEQVEWECPHELYWTRRMADVTCTAASYESTAENNPYSYSEIWIGHTSLKNKKPLIWETWVGTTVIMLDTGGGWPDGKITIMDIDTKEYWQSDTNLYSKIYR